MIADAVFVARRASGAMLFAIKCQCCNRICGEEWHESAETAALEAQASGWTVDAETICPECQLVGAEETYPN